MKKRLLAIIATMALVVTMIPAMAFADSATEVSTGTEFKQALDNDESVVFKTDIEMTMADSNGYGGTGVRVNNGETINGNGFTFGVTNANGNWDSAIATSGGIIKNLTINKGWRGIFIVGGAHTERVILDNVIINGPGYTVHCDGAANQGLTAKNSSFYGWTSFAGSIGDVEFIDCKFFEDSEGYKFIRPYAPTKFIGCDFEEGYVINPRDEIMLVNCKLNGEPITKDNISDIISGDETKVTINNCVYTDESGQIQYREDHVFGNELKKDADNHWFECDCGEKEEVAPHKYVNGVCECGAKAPAEKPEKSPNTGDNSLPYTLAVAGMVLAAMAAVVATRKRTN